MEEDYGRPQQGFQLP